ncbi:hypothetical protein pdam_00020852 [Pocillopora damicornis]|uniref:Uncharacterized protein n=1 Tax=Pocillopora damicornis TaxID=46731 RepID=A0A3M6TXP7_POCDA|nr:hypothetical protein pdam_00020852 [Pocillopora damicornis]
MLCKLLPTQTIENTLPQYFPSRHIATCFLQIGKYTVMTLDSPLLSTTYFRTNLKKLTILYQGPKIWNSLPISITSFIVAFSATESIYASRRVPLHQGNELLQRRVEDFCISFISYHLQVAGMAEMAFT